MASLGHKQLSHYLTISKQDVLKLVRNLKKRIHLRITKNLRPGLCSQQIGKIKKGGMVTHNATGNARGGYIFLVHSVSLTLYIYLVHIC